ncbi:Secretion system effector SseC [Candidatus Glomeribacter gigasporarum BEG34]|uniref:Secretion system effector SseC n=1 Tax=Candidatus Glomeribacter gigasporarum BEG34 TaxID=1070319 RepID=G2JB78_9BURK|nr:type III secretion system translocon subunit SctE [Candidatus Glomeribacter gigasporarum]CCD30031.1 Secretion system effector SseC [Candidatus Glomeribacter gigasporarum BEG34]
MTAIGPAISPEFLYWANPSNAQALPSQENKRVEGAALAQEKQKGPHANPAKYQRLALSALVYAIYAELMEFSRELLHSMDQNLERMHQAERALRDERLELYAQEVQKFLEAQEKARNGGIVTTVFDFFVSAAGIVAGAVQLYTGIVSGNPLKIASGVALLSGGMLGLGNVLLETMTFGSHDPSAYQLSDQLRAAQAACTIAGFVINGMGAFYEWLQGSRIAGSAARAAGGGRNSAVNSTTRPAAEAAENAPVVTIRVTGNMAKALQRLAQSAGQNSAEDFLTRFSNSIRHLYIITSVTNQLLSVLQKIVNGVIGHEIAQSEAQGKKLRAQGEFLKTLTSIQREMINQLLKQEKEHAIRIGNDQTALIQSSQMLTRSSLRAVHALAQAA